MATASVQRSSSSPGPVGIARLAAESPRLYQRAGTAYYALEARSALNRESSGCRPFAWTLNPYRGCEFGCKSCYARYTHEFLERWDGRDFERKIYAKANAPALLRGELRAAKDRGLAIALGTATTLVSLPRSNSKSPAACSKSSRNSRAWISPSAPNLSWFFATWTCCRWFPASIASACT